MSLPTLQLRVRVHGRHPWFFRKMVRKPAATLPAGGPVAVVDRDGRPVGTGFYNPRSEIALRMLSRHMVGDVEAELVRRLDDAISVREDVLRLPETTDAYRLVHAEGDGIPGLILDRFADTVVAQVFAQCTMATIEPLGERLLARDPGTHLVLTADAEAVRREGMVRPPPPPRRDVVVTEHGLRYLVQPGLGHKTGFFADQRPWRRLAGTLARGRRVLDLCCNAGGFALQAARGGASRVRAVDLDEAAVERTRDNAARNGLRLDAIEHADAFDVLRDLPPGEADLIVLDPPKWAANRAELDTARGRYRDLNRLALASLEPGALLLTCSCSGSLSMDGFTAIVREAAADAGRDAAILAEGGAGPDHPVALECPETRYLKVLLLRVGEATRPGRRAPPRRGRADGRSGSGDAA